MWIFWTMLLTVIGTGLLLYSFHKDDKLKGLCGFVGSFIILIAIIIHSSNTIEPKPTALDVYRGNTELKVISVNGVPTDTVVVFKNK